MPRKYTKSDIAKKLDDYEHKLIIDALMKANGVIRKAAADLGLSRYGLYKRVKRLGINLDDFRSHI